MRIEPQRLKYLLAVARAGGVLAAADEMRVTPSAVSQQLSRLEQEIGRQLVVRTPQGAVLTADGLAVAQAAEDIERTLNLVTARLEEEDAGPTGTVRVGAFHSILRAILIPGLDQWRTTHPGLRFELVEADADDLMKALRAGEVDMVLCELDAGESPRKLPASMTETPLLDEPWKLVMPRGTLTSVDAPDLGSLPLPWLGIDSSAASAQAVRRISRALAGNTVFVHRYLETQTGLALVAAGEGVALVPSLALHGVPDAGFDALDVPGLGMRRIVLRRYERRRTPEALDVAASLIREAAAAFDFGGEFEPAQG